MLDRFRIFWKFIEHERGFTWLTPLFCVEVSLDWIKVINSYCFWRGWRIYWWPNLEINTDNLLIFSYYKERIEEQGFRDIMYEVDPKIVKYAR